MSIGDKIKADKLHKAVERNDWEKARQLIAEGAVPALRTLNQAVLNPQNATWLKMLMAAGGQPAPDTLRCAVELHKEKSARVLIEAGVCADGDMLAHALRNLDKTWVKMLLEAGAGPAGAELLHQALLHDNMKDAKMLLEAGLVPAGELLAQAVEMKHAVWVRLFAGYGAQPATHMLTTATCNGDMETAKLLIDGGAVPDSKALEYAINNLDNEWLKMLLDAGAVPTQDLMDIAGGKRNMVAMRALTDKFTEAAAKAAESKAAAPVADKPRASGLRISGPKTSGPRLILCQPPPPFRLILRKS